MAETCILRHFPLIKMIDIFDKVVMAMIVIVVVTFSVLYTERPMLVNNAISINGSYNNSDNKFLEGLYNTTTTTVRVFNRTKTTTTIALMITSDVGSPVVAVDTISGSVIVNCGSTPSFIDKLYLNGFFPVRYAYITSLNESNMGGCSRAFLLHMPGNVYDSGVDYGASGLDNYKFVVGDKRKSVKVGNVFRLINVNGSVIDDYRGKLSIFIDFGSYSMLYLGGCFNCTSLINEYRPRLLVIDDNIEFSIVDFKPDILVGKFNGANIDGVDIFDLSSEGDFKAHIDRDGIHT